MDVVKGQPTQDDKNNFKEVLLQREHDRKEKIKNLKDDKDLSVSDQVKLFHESFEEQSQNIKRSISLIEEGTVDKKQLPEHFSIISKNIQVLNKYLSMSTVFLKNYSVRKCLQTIEELESKVKNLESELLPKKKFGFKTRNTKVVEKLSKPVDELDANSDRIIKTSAATVSCGFLDRKDENLKLSSGISKNDVELRNLQNCSVTLSGNPSTIHISNARQCKILSGPVSTSVFVENCQDCDFVIACQQLRIHSTKNCRFYIHVTSRAIIEDSSEVEFAPYNLNYEGLEKHFDVSGLDRSQNNWNQIDDFNWLASDSPSPNWKVIDKGERVQSWLL